MAEYTGEALYLKFGSTVLSGDFRQFSVSENVDLVDASAGADAARTYLARLEDGTASLRLLDQSDGTALWDALDKGTSGTLEWAPEGTATGNGRHYAVAIVSSRERSMPYDGVVELSVEFQLSGVVTDTVY